MIKIAYHQAINLFQLGKYGFQHTGFVRHPESEDGMRQHEDFVDGGPQSTPLRKVREDKDGVEREDWIYGSPPLKMTFVSFEEDEVVEVKDYEGGIGGAVQVSSDADDPIPH